MSPAPVITDPDLLAEIEADILGGRPLADALRRCVILGGKVGSTELREWATRELRGYDADVPDYRTVPAGIFADAATGAAIVTGQHIGTSMLPDFARDDLKEQVKITQGVGEIEALVTQAHAHEDTLRLALPMSTELARVMDSQSGNPFQQITALYWKVPAATLVGVLDQVRTTVAELVAEMRAGTPRNQRIPTAEVAAQAINVAINGDTRHVTVTSSQAASGGESHAATREPEPSSGFWTLSRRIGAVVVGVATVAATWIGYLQLHSV